MKYRFFGLFPFALKSKGFFMFKKFSCFVLIFIITLLSASCARKSETAPVSSQTTAYVSRDDNELTTGKYEAKKSNKDKTKDKKQATTTKKSDSKKKSEKATKKTEKKSQAKKSEKKKSPAKKQPTTKSGSSTTKAVSTTEDKNSLNIKITIDCTAAAGKVDGVPKYYLNNFSLKLEKGATAYSATKAACAKEGISVVATKTVYGEYICAIGSLAEKTTSKYSGWTYTVNGKYPPKAADKYTLENGDVIRWIYKA